MSDKNIKKEIARDLEEKKKKEIEQLKKDYAESHHKASLTRRELLGAGLISFSAYAAAPTLLSLLSSTAHAQDAEGCPAAEIEAGAARMAPFITLNLQGGAMLAANYVPMNENRDVLASYNKMGLGNNQVPIEREFNNAPFAGNGISKLLTQLRANTSQTTRNNVAFIAIPNRSRDDSGANKLDASGLVAKAGLIGETLPNLGTRDSSTGVRQEFALVKPPNPLRVQNLSDLNGALGGGATGALANLDNNQKTNLIDLIKNLSTSQTQKVMADSGGRTLASLIKCATGKNSDLARKAKPSVDVRANANTAAIWGVNAGTSAGNKDVVFGSMTTSGLIGASGSVNLELGGYDYHNKTRTTGDKKDGEAGAVIGKILETAAALNQKVFLYVTSDGACVSPVSDSRSAVWQSDRGSAGVAYILAYDPAGRPATSDFQIGHFTNAQSADSKFITGGSPELAAAAAFANYLKFNNKMDLLEKVIPGTFNVEDLKKIIKFG